MKRILFIMFSVLIAGATLQSCKKSDSDLKKDVDKALVSYSNQSITTAVKDGVVTLSGAVPTEAEKMAIQNMVTPLKGVKSVVNNIMVPTQPTTPAPTVNSDDTIKTSIESRLNREGFKDVKVEVKNGEVTLMGDLKRADLTKVMQIANESKPRKVINNLNLK